jgi:putative DNA primase/helicase
LGAVQYERERKDAAERLGLRAAILDRLVQAERPSDSNGKQGRAVAFADPEPWESPVDGAELLDAIAEAVSRYVVLSEHSRDVAALWVTHTHLLDCFSISPRLAISSPVMRCGKSTLIDVLARLVLRPLPTENVTASAVFRVVEAYRPTLLVDEADTFVRENDELRGIINSGHRRNGSVLRIVGEDHEARAFSTYSACAIALIGTLPDTLHDRSVPISLKRRLAKEPITPFRHDQVGHLDVLAKQAARWARDYAAAVSAAEPAMPEGVFNREADNLHTLLAIA